MKTVSVARRIEVPAQEAWSVIRSGALDKWVPGVTACTIDGAKRTVVMSGHTILETIETVDDESRLYQYWMNEQSVMPLRDLRGTLHVSEAGPSATNVLWFSNFELVDEGADAAVTEGITALYNAAIDGLEQCVKSQS